MYAEAYVAIVVLALIVPFALLYFANQAYQRQRWDQREGDRFERECDDVAEEIRFLNQLDLEAQIAEDTCTEHRVFCCDRCFDFSPA